MQGTLEREHVYKHRFARVNTNRDRQNIIVPIAMLAHCVACRQPCFYMDPHASNMEGQEGFQMLQTEWYAMSTTEPLAI